MTKTTRTESSKTDQNIMRFRLTGVAPMLMHNAQMSDPLNPHAKALKAVTSKRTKTDADLEEIARLEWRGGLYYDKDLGPAIPSDIIDAVMVTGAKKNKLGKAFKSAVFAVNGPFKVNYTGPRDEKDLWKDPKFRSTMSLRVGTARVMRTRPIFNEWSIDIDIMLIEGEEVNANEVFEALQNGGVSGGIGDFRPKYGRFTVTKL